VTAGAPFLLKHPIAAEEHEEAVVPMAA